MIKQFRRWLRKDDGVTAVEFSMVAMPMFLMIFGIIEMSMFFASTTVLEGASSEAARRIRTGQVASAGEGMSAAEAEAAERAAFEELMCTNVGIMMNCDNIQYEVINMNADTFSDAGNYAPEYDIDGNLVIHPFDVGCADTVVLIRTYYKRTFLTPFINTMLTAGSGRDWVPQMSTVVIRTEPYDLTNTGC